MSQPARILIIDDEKAIRNTLKEILEFENYTVDKAEDGPAGLDMLIQQRYDVVLTDLMMPGMSGQELLRAVRAVAPETEVVLMTAYGTVETAVSAMREGAYDFVEKPFSNNGLVDRVEAALAASAAALARREARQLRERSLAGQQQEQAGCDAPHHSAPTLAPVRADSATTRRDSSSNLLFARRT